MGPAARAAGLGLLAAGVLGQVLRREGLQLVGAEPGWLGLPDAGHAATWARCAAGLAVLNLAAWGAGGPLARRFEPHLVACGPGPARLALGFGALSVAVLALAALHALHPAAIALLLGAAALAGGGALVRQGKAWPRVRAALGRQRLPLAAATLLLAAPALAAFDRNPGWDALTYHLAIPERYAFANAIVVSPWSVFSAFPHATGMLYLLAQQLAGDPLARLLHLEFGVLVAGVAWHQARASGPRAAWWALAALAACPLFTWELSVAYADLSATLYSVLAVAVMAGPESGRRRWLAVGLLAGAAAACRYPSWPLVGVLALCPWLPGVPGPQRAGERVRASAWVGVGALAVLAPWLLRNALLTGNPVAPLLQSFFSTGGDGFFAPLALEQNADFLRAIGMGRGPLDLLALPWNLTLEARADDYAAFGYRIGPLYAIALAAGLLAGRRAGGAAWWWPAGLLTLAWFFTSQEPRYLLPALVLVAIAGARAAAAIVVGRFARRLAAGLAALAVATTQLPWLSSLPQRYGIAAGRIETQPDAAEQMAAQLRSHLPAGHRVVLLFEPRGHRFAGLDYVPYHLGDGSPLWVAIGTAAARGTLAQLFSDLGASHVLLERRLRPITTPRFTPRYPRERFEADVRALERFLARHAIREREVGSLALYRLEGPA